MSAVTRRITLCADDYGIAPGVNAAIRDLVARARLSATSVMTVAPAFTPAEVAALADLNQTTKRAAIGLHLTLTAPFRPLSANYAPLRDGAFLSLGSTLKSAMLRRLEADALAREVRAQLEAFIAAFGGPPDFIDGHQHVQLFPQVRDALLVTARALVPEAWVRQCGRPRPLSGWQDRKALLLDLLSVGFRARAHRLGMRTNPAFAGTYDFDSGADFASLFPRFLDAMPDGGLIMCHPGFVDAELQKLDPLTALREREHAYLAGDAFPKALAAQGVSLA